MKNDNMNVLAKELEGDKEFNKSKSLERISWFCCSLVMGGTAGIGMYYLVGIQEVQFMLMSCIWSGLVSGGLMLISEYDLAKTRKLERYSRS